VQQVGQGIFPSKKLMLKDRRKKDEEERKEREETKNSKKFTYKDWQKRLTQRRNRYTLHQNHSSTSFDHDLLLIGEFTFPILYYPIKLIKFINSPWQHEIIIIKQRKMIKIG
jgi:hypothetical protein